MQMCHFLKISIFHPGLQWWQRQPLLEILQRLLSHKNWIFPQWNDSKSFSQEVPAGGGEEFWLASNEWDGQRDCPITFIQIQLIS